LGKKCVVVHLGDAGDQTQISDLLLYIASKEKCRIERKIFFFYLRSSPFYSKREDKLSYLS